MKLLVVNFHYYREKTYGSGIYPTSRKQLLSQVDLIHKNGYQFCSLAELIALKKNSSIDDKKYCLLTFDDGLKEQLEAFSDLKKLGLPSHYFVCSRPYIEKDFLDVHKLHLIKTKVSDGKLHELMLNNKIFLEFDFNLELLKVQYRYDSLKSAKVKYFINFGLNAIERRILLDSLFETAVGNMASALKDFYLSKDDIQLLDSDGFVGLHSHSHDSLGTLSLEQSLEEIQKNKSFLDSVGCSKIKSFSYPYGGKSAVRNDLDESLTLMGVEFAFTMERKLNLDLSSPLTLGRFDTNDVFGGRNFDNSKHALGGITL